METLLLFHASAELYGSDRTLLELARGLDRRRWRPVVALPRAGPLARELRAAGVVVEIGPVGTFGRATLTPGGLVRAAQGLPRSVAWARWLVRAHRPRLVHTNTLVVLCGALAARAEGLPHVWHVHEILERPRLVARALAHTVAGLSQSVVCNSHATAANLCSLAPALAGRCSVIHNGIADFERRPTRAEARTALGLASDEACVALVGRINRSKGQALLLEACARLRSRHPRISVLFCGDAPPGQPEHLEALDAEIARSPLADRVRILPFREDIELVYAAADVVAVPSTAPESFGLVAVEAMSLARPVVAAAQGGLLEIVADGETGLLFPVRDAAALATAISALLSDPVRAGRLGRAARERQQQRFALARYLREFEELYAGFLPWEARAQARRAA
jgi:glycosyltransferase involved in cell wall biosynthesis